MIISRLSAYRTYEAKYRDYSGTFGLAIVEIAVTVNATTVWVKVTDSPLGSR